MSIKATHRDAIDLASTQVSFAEFFSGCVPEPAELDDGNLGIQEGDIDYSRTVFASDNGDRYHKARAGVVPACPTINGEKITLAVAADRDLEPCKVCNPISYPRTDEMESATLAEFCDLCPTAADNIDGGQD